MRPESSLIIAFLLLGALLAPTGTASGAVTEAEAEACSTRHLVTALGHEVVWEGYACLTDDQVLEASQESASPAWLSGSTPETVCTALSWFTQAGQAWFGAPCGSVLGAQDPRAAGPCETLDLAGQAARDVCNALVAPQPSAAAAPDCGDLLSPSTTTSAAELPCGITVPDVPDVPDVPNLRELIPDYDPELPDPEVPDPEIPDPDIDCENLLSLSSTSTAAAEPADCIPDIVLPPTYPCPPGQVGRKVGNVNACVSSDVDCDTFFPSALAAQAAATDCVGDCEDPGDVGATIGTLNACVNQPEVGICNTRDGEYGVVVNGKETCVHAEVGVCPSYEGYGVVVNGVYYCYDADVRLCTAEEGRGVVVNEAEYCYDADVKVCPTASDEYGVIINGVRYCVKVSLTPCDDGYIGYRVQNVNACVKEPVVCSAGYGLEPNCHTVRECPGVEEGVEVDDTRVCRDVSPVPCQDGEIGYEPACVLVQDCPSGTGAVVNGFAVCVPPQRLCTVGYGVEPYCAKLDCPAGTVGGHVGTTGVCYPVPDVCDDGYGVEPHCVVLCPAGSVGAYYRTTGACVPIPQVCTTGYGVEPYCVSTCPPGYVGAKVGSTTVCTPTPRACPAPESFGLEPDCHYVQECEGSEVGVEVDDTDVCRDPPERCDAPATGYEPACVLVEDCPSGYDGAVINGQEACVPTPVVCSTGYGVQPYCVVVCPSGYIGANVANIGVCYPVPEACPVPSVGVQPDCHTARECPGTEVGVEVDNTRVCRDPNPDPCTEPETGYEPACVLVEDCPVGYTGVVVEGQEACAPTPEACTVGYGVEPYCATICPSGSIGVKVGSAGVCYPTPQACPVPSVGVQPDCHTAGACPSGTYGVLVDGEGDCHTARECPGTEVGVEVDDTRVCRDVIPDPCPSPELGYEPACVSKEDCPPGSTGAIVNGLRACVPDPILCGQGYGLEPNCVVVCPSGELGVKMGNTDLCTPIPQACAVPSVGVEPDCHTVGACPTGTYGVLVDGQGGCHTIELCTSGEYGVRVDSTDLCQEVPEVPDDQDHDGYKDTEELSYGSNLRDSDSRRTTDDDGDLMLNYMEPYTGSTYGRALCTGAYGIVADSSCGGYAKPAGLQSNSIGVDAEDRVWVWDAVCASGAQGSYTGCKNGNYAGSATMYTGTFTGDGYGWRHVTDVPLADSYSVNVVVPCQDLEEDNDGDGVNVYHVCNARLTVYRDGSTSLEETGVRTSAGDPDDTDPENPIPDLPNVGIEDGPYTTVERSTGDGVHYKVGAVVSVAGTPVDLVQEDTVDAGALPVTFSVPTGEAPAYGPDADGDGLPAYVEIPVSAWTIHDTATLTTTTAPASPMRVPIDNDDDEHVLGGSSKSVTVPSWMQPGPDADMDGIPSTVTVEFTTVTVFTDGSYTIERAPEQDQSRAVDPDDSDADNPAPQFEDPVPITSGPLGHSEDVEGVSTPPVEGRNVTTPPVTMPATCTMSPCDEETVVREEGEVSTPPAPGAGVPSSEEVCAEVPALCDENNMYCAPAGIICVGPHGGITVTEEGEPQTVPTPGVSAPAICQAAPGLCLPPTTVVEEETHEFQGIGPVHVTPAVFVSVAWTGFDGYVDPNVGTFTTVGPIVIDGPVPVTVCASTCSLPVPPEASGEGSVTVMLVAGDEEYVVTQPISF